MSDTMVSMIQDRRHVTVAMLHKYMHV